MNKAIKRALLVINYTSGKAENSLNLGNLIKELGKTSMIITMIPAGDIINLRANIIANIENNDLLIGAGGDGTINILINILMELPREKRLPLFIIPMGTTCDFARTLKIPLNPTTVAANLPFFHKMAIDVGQIGDRYFSYVAAFGAFSDVSYTTPIEMKKRLGHLAYIIEGIKGINKLNSYQMSINIDGVNLEGKFLFVAISNSTSIGGLLKYPDTHVSINDGQFELLLLRDQSVNFLRTAQIAKVLLPNYYSQDLIFLKGNQFKFSTMENVPWTIDGEYAGNFTDVSIKVHKQAIDVMLPNLHSIQLK